MGILHLEVSDFLPEQAPGTHFLVPANAGSIPNSIPPAPSLSAAYLCYCVRQEYDPLGEAVKAAEAAAVLQRDTTQCVASLKEEHGMGGRGNRSHFLGSVAFAAARNTSDPREIRHARF